MKRYDMAQGSPEWHKARLGIPTGSCFEKIVTPGGKMSKQSTGYMHRLLAEWITGAPLEDVQTDWMIRGQELEAQAVEAYEFHSGNTCEVVGFVTNDEGTIGVSPDRLVGDDGVLEIKCPSPAVHVGYMLGNMVERDYWPQVQGEIWIPERQWVDVCSYCPGMPTVVHRIVPDPEYVKLLAAALAEFTANLAAAKAELIERYGISPKEVELPAAKSNGLEALGITDEDIDRLVAQAFLKKEVARE